MSEQAALQHAVISLDQLDATIVRYADAIDEALQEAIEGGEPGAGEQRLTLLASITQALESRKEDVIDEIVNGLLGLEENVALAQQKADRYLVAKQKMLAARDKIRVHIMKWIDSTLPEDGRKLQGKLFFLRTQGNGGLPALVVRDETAVPREYFILRPKLVLPAAVSGEQLQAMQAFLDEFIPGARLTVDLAKPELDEDAVRMALTAKLDVPGASLEQGRHLRHSNPAKKPTPRLARGQKALPEPPAQEVTS